MPRANHQQRTIVQLLHFVPHAYRSMEAFLVELAARLNQDSWRTVYVFSGEPSDRVRQRLMELNSPYIVAEFPMNRTRAGKLARQLLPYKPLIIQSHFVSPFSVALPILKWKTGARRLIVTDHSSGGVSKRSAIGRLFARVRGIIAGVYIDRVTAVSDFIRLRDINGIYLPAGKVGTVYNGVDLERFSSAPSPCNEIFTIAYVGQLIPEKGVRTLLRAIASIMEHPPMPFRVVLAGKGPERESLEQFCREHKLDCVEFVGQIDWVPKLLSSADVVVIPSEWQEACAFAVIEAMACGACMIVADAGGNPELVGASQDAGLIYRSGNAEALQEKLLMLMADPARRAQHRAHARQRAQANFSIARMVEEHAQVAHKVAGTRNLVPCP